MIADEPEKPEKPPVTFEGESEANRIVQEPRRPTMASSLVGLGALRILQEICNNAKVQEKVRVQVEARESLRMQLPWTIPTPQIEGQGKGCESRNSDGEANSTLSMLK